MPHWMTLPSAVLLLYLPHPNRRLVGWALTTVCGMAIHIHNLVHVSGRFTSSQWFNDVNENSRQGDTQETQTVP